MGRFFLTRGLRNLRQGNPPSRCQTQKGNCLTIGFLSLVAISFILGTQKDKKQ